MATSSIEWTELNWFATAGCDKISAGCKLSVPLCKNLIDTLIAGCAASRNLTLVHCDEHLAAVPPTRLANLHLSSNFREARI